MHPTACGRRREGQHSTQGNPSERRGSTAGFRQDSTKSRTIEQKARWALILFFFLSVHVCKYKFPKQSTKQGQ